MCPASWPGAFAGRGESGTKEVTLMPTGKVKWFDPKKGYGFIIGDQGQDVFVHYTAIVGDGFRALKDGELE